LTGCSSKPPVSEIYLVSGGTDYYEIEKSIWGPPLIKNDVITQISIDGDRLTLTQSGMGIVFFRFHLSPSESVPGDWDLVDFERPFNLLGKPDKEMKHLEQPIPSYLHRLDDERIVLYFDEVRMARVREMKPDPARLLDLASQLLSAYPEDLHVRPLYLDALIAQQDPDKLEETLAAWKPDYDNPDAFPFRTAYRHAQHNLDAMRLTAARQNAYDFMLNLFSDKSNLATRLDKFPAILQYDRYACPSSLLMGGSTPNFLEMQTMQKVFGVESVFMLLEGRRKEALDLLTAGYRLGQMLNREGYVINRLIGIALRGISIGGLDIYTLNACETTQDVENLWSVLEGLNVQEFKGSPEDLTDMEGLYDFFTDSPEIVVRHRASNAKFQNVRMAAATVDCLLRSDAFPEKTEDFSRFFPSGLPIDPFGSQSMRFQSRLDSFTCYSIGPDEQDDGGALVYDPTNGTLSQGDISLEIPRTRKYPFDPDGISVENADQMKDLFPKGLPIDPFGPRKDENRSLQVSKTVPVYVYSRGPDLDVDTGDAIERFTPEHLYDPTNGTITDGDLFVRIAE